MIKKSICILFLFVSLNFISVDAASTDKEHLPYEISSIQALEEGFQIKGWGMISHLQHFRQYTHYYELVLTSDNHQLFYTSLPLFHDQTETMMQFRTQKCGEGIYHQDASSCYYDYTHTGFEFVIPYEQLRQDEIYEVDLVIYTYETNMRLSTKLFYPTLKPCIKVIDQIEYKAKSNLYDTQLKVVYENVLERSTPLKYASYRESATYCSATYGHRIYFDVYSDFKHVYDRIESEGTTYYKIMTSASTTCKNGQNRSLEGNDRYSWIAGNFVDYLGIPLTIEIKKINEPPILTIMMNPIIKQGWKINPFDYLTAWDKEDGDLTDKIQWISGEIGNQIGEYQLTFQVEDSQGEKDIKTMTVTVIKGNTPPQVSAADRTIYQYTEFDYMKGVSAFDFEDGNISHGIWHSGEVNVEELGLYPITYYCIDSEGLIHSKTITVEVIRNPNEKIRYIDSKLLWFEEDIPRNWIYKYPYLYEQLKTPRIWSMKNINLY